MRKKFSKFALEGIVSQGVLSALSFLWIALLARQLSVSQMGLVMVSLASSSAIIAFCGFSLQHSISVKACQYDKQTAVTNGLLALIIAGAITGFIGFIVAAIFSLQRKYGVSEIFCGMLVSVQLVHAYISSIARSIDRFRLANVLSIIQPGIFSFLIFLNAPVGLTPSIQLVFAQYMASSIVSIILYFIIFHRDNLIKLSVVEWQIVGSLFKFGSRAQFGNMAKEVMYRADLFLVSIILGSAASGYYAVVLKVIDGVGRYVDGLGLILLPTIAKLKPSHRNDLTIIMVSRTILFASVISILISMSGSYIVELLFGENFQPSVKLLEIGIYSTIPLFAWKVLANDFIGRGFLGCYAASTLIGAVSIIFLNYIFLEVYGLIVAPWVLIFSYGIAFTILLVLAYYKFGMLLIPKIKGNTSYKVNNE